MVLTLVLSQQLDLALYSESAGNVWFQADTGRTLSNMVDPGSDHYRTKVHPIFSITAYPIVAAGRAVWSGTDLEAAMRVQSLIAGLWLTAFYTLARLLSFDRLTAALVSVLGATSASFMYWFAVPETYDWGSLSLCRH